ncbi:NUDIX hydrolase [Catellatospora methionotrophica]|uniref:NUDIX hydrolase n=1 Tax=Catellatospora methionotrophica TaxID=121620 RepID=UPI0033E1470E
MSADDRFPLLFAPQRWEWAGVDCRFSTAAPADRLVTNVHVVGFAGDRVVLCRDARDVWFLPGGTREPGETVAECAARELREEAGAVLRGPLHVIGAHHAVSDRPAPYRPHQPHPEMAWLWCYAEVSVEHPPVNPDDGETVLEVRAHPLDDARRLLLTDAPWYPELLTLATEQRTTDTAPTL